MSSTTLSSLLKALYKCEEECGKCKSQCIEHGSTELINICELCMLACKGVIMCLNRPTHCSPLCRKESMRHCKAMVKVCHQMCKTEKHAKHCEQACTHVLAMLK